MKRLLVIDSDYPNEHNLGDGFVHIRVKQYQRHFDVSVAGLNDRLPRRFTYEGVSVRNFSSREQFLDYVRQYGADALLVHFFQGWMLQPVALAAQVPLLIWVHGGEALAWYRRLFKYSPTLQSLRTLAFDIPTVTRQMYRWHRLIALANRTNLVKLVFVSQWMKRMVESDSLSRSRRHSVIPNPIDTTLFPYRPKTAGHRKSILVLRSFHSKKYAGDQIVAAILRLSQTSIFHDLRFVIRGWGEPFDRAVAPLRRFPNITLYKGSIEQKAISALHGDHGVFLCPTRQDAQGVSMCEAMASGLVPVSSNNTAIPEFVTHGETGLLTQSTAELADGIAHLYHHPEAFLRMSQQAATSIRSVCGVDQIAARELAIIEQALGSAA